MAEKNHRQYVQRIGDLPEHIRKRAEVVPLFDIELHASKYEKVSYQEKMLPLPDTLRNAIRLIQTYCDDLLSILSVDTKMFVDKKTSDEGMVTHKKITRSEIGRRQKQLWTALQEIIPDLPSFSKESFTHFLLYQVPRLLAPYGIFAKAVSLPGMNFDTDRLSQSEGVLSFFEIERVEKQKKEYWGKMVYLDIVYLKGAFEENTHESTRLAGMSSAQTYYQSIIMYPKSNRGGSWYREAVAAAGETLTFLQSLSEEELIRRMSVKSGEVQESLASRYPYYAVLGKLAQKKDIDRIRDESDIAHEARHVIDAQDSELTKRFAPQRTTSVHGYLVNMANHMTHEEINGFLGELRYAFDPLYSFHKIILDPSPSSMYGHTRGCEWIKKTLLDILERDYKQYGIKQYPYAVPLRLQILVQLPKIISDRKKWNKLIEKIQSIHRERMDEDFSERYIAQMKGKFSE